MKRRAVGGRSAPAAPARVRVPVDPELFMVFEALQLPIFHQVGSIQWRRGGGEENTDDDDDYESSRGWRGRESAKQAELGREGGREPFHSTFNGPNLPPSQFHYFLASQRTRKQLARFALRTISLSELGKGSEGTFDFWLRGQDR